jgi:serine/threonine protein kinase
VEEGTYGVVYRAMERKTKEIVALKRLKMEKEKEGFPITSLREINTLLISQHPNVVTVREIVVGSDMDRIYIGKNLDKKESYQSNMRSISHDIIFFGILQDAGLRKLLQG